MILQEIVALLNKLPAGTVVAIFDLIGKIAESEDPLAAAKRAVEEEARIQAFDLAQRKLRG